MPVKRMTPVETPVTSEVINTDHQDGKRALDVRLQGSDILFFAYDFDRHELVIARSTIEDAREIALAILHRTHDAR